MLVLAFAALGSAVSAPAQAASPLEIAKRAIEVRELANPHGPAQFAVTRNGETIAYVVTEPRGDGAAYSSSLYAGRLHGERSKDRLLVKLPDSPAPFAQPSPRFSPDGSRIAFLADGGVDEVALGTGKRRSLTASRVPQGSEVLDFAWSPDGARLALRLAMPSAPEVVGGREMDVSWPLGGQGAGTRLAVLEASGTAKIVTGPELDVGGMSWSPDGQFVALAASPTSSNDRFFDQDIYLADLQTGRTTLVAKLDGVDSDPVWSPDGRHLAFATQARKGNHDWLQQLGLIDAATGDVSFPAGAQFDAGLGSPHDMVWRDGDHLLFTSAHHLRSPIFELNAVSGKLRRVSPLNFEYLAGIAVAPNAGVMLFGCETIDRPRELCTSSTASFSEQRLTNLNPALSLPSEKTSIVSWKSSDAQWTLEGILIEPLGRRRPVPVITVIEGGPSMVRTQYQLEQQYPVHAFIAAGYAVFLPNTRGRTGYSKAFRRAIPDHRDYVDGGFGDIMSGLDKLASMGLADPRRLGIAGFSYGGVLSAYAITRTDRFAAASILDAPVDIQGLMKLGAANPAIQAQWHDQVGYSNVYDPNERALMEAQSPLERMADASTPALLEYGMKAYGGFDESGGAELYQALERFQVPALFVRYPRSGHGIYEPRLRMESARRNLDWFARWFSSGRPVPGAQGESTH